MHVLIIGGGLGGLCLAHGLKKAGIPHEVFERDSDPSARMQGYRLHIDIRGAQGLYQCLPPNLYELFLATTGKPGVQVSVVTKKLKLLHVHTFAGEPDKTDDGAKPKNPAAISTSVDRGILSAVLRAGLGDTLHYDKPFTHYETGPSGRIQAFFADGSVAEGNVLVGADGIHSKVRRQLLPDAQIIDTGARCIYGKTLLTDSTRPLIPELLQKGFISVIDHKQKLGLAAGLVQFKESPGEAAARLAPEAEFNEAEDYMMWALTGKSAQLGCSDRELLAMSPADLHHLALRRVRTWDSAIRELVKQAYIDATFCLRMQTSTPVPRWKTTNVTLLGDAIHAMLPSRGSGANMALWDAKSLCNKLTATASRDKTLLHALEEYELEMTARGFEAVRASQENSLAVPPSYNLVNKFLGLFRRSK